MESGVTLFFRAAVDAASRSELVFTQFFLQEILVCIHWLAYVEYLLGKYWWEVTYPVHCCEHLLLYARSGGTGRCCVLGVYWQKMLYPVY